MQLSFNVEIDQCLMRCILLDKNGKVGIVATPAMCTSSQCHCNCAGRELDLEGHMLGHSCEVLGLMNDPVSTRSSEIDPCSPNPWSLICAGPVFPQLHLLNECIEVCCLMCL